MAHLRSRFFEPVFVAHNFAFDDTEEFRVRRRLGREDTTTDINFKDFTTDG